MNYKGTAEVRISYTYPFSIKERALMKGRCTQSGEVVPYATRLEGCVKFKWHMFSIWWILGAIGY